VHVLEVYVKVDSRIERSDASLFLTWESSSILMPEMMDIEFTLKHRVPPTIPLAFELSLAQQRMAALLVQLKQTLVCCDIEAIRLATSQDASNSMFPNHVVVKRCLGLECLAITDFKFANKGLFVAMGKRDVQVDLVWCTED
jgi:hypothetical protein